MSTSPISELVVPYDPGPLADKVARSTSTHTVEEIATEIIDVIRNAATAQPQ